MTYHNRGAITALEDIKLTFANPCNYNLMLPAADKPVFRGMGKTFSKTITKTH